MHSVKPRHSNEDIAKRGDAIYEKDILPKLTIAASSRQVVRQSTERDEKWGGAVQLVVGFP